MHLTSISPNTPRFGILMPSTRLVDLLHPAPGTPPDRFVGLRTAMRQVVSEQSIKQMFAVLDENHIDVTLDFDERAFITQLQDHSGAPIGESHSQLWDDEEEADSPQLHEVFLHALSQGLTELSNRLKALKTTPQAASSAS